MSIVIQIWVQTGQEAAPTEATILNNSTATHLLDPTAL